MLWSLSLSRPCALPKGEKHFNTDSASATKISSDYVET